MEGTIVIVDKTFDFDFVRVNQTCWSGDLKTGAFSVHIGCDGIVLKETLHFKQSFQYIDVDANGTLGVRSSKDIAGCKTTLAGYGSAVIDFKLGFNVPRINFRMSAVGCPKFFEGALMVDDKEMHQGMILPLGHANLKIENLGAAVSYTKSKAIDTDPNLRVALVGTIGGGVQDKDKLDIILAFDQVNWMITGVVEGPISLAGIISQVAPGVYLSNLDPGHHIGVIHDALLFAKESLELLVAFKITAFGMDCSAQMTVGGDKIIEGGSARVTVFIQVHAEPKDLPAPLDKLSLLFGGGSEVSLVFAMATHPIEKTKNLNPADEVYEFLTFFDELVGTEEDVKNEHLFGGLDIIKRTNTSEIHELIGRAKRVSKALGTETLPVIEGTGAGPGVLAAVKISSQHEKFTSLVKDVSNVAAFSDSLPKGPTFELIANFNWNSAELKLLLDLVLTHNFTSSSQKHIGLRSLMLLADIKETEVDFGFGISFLYHSVSNQSFDFEGFVIVTSNADLQIKLTAWSWEVWNNPLGISPNIAVLFPVSMGFGINMVAGVPTSLLLAGGLSIMDQSAFTAIALSADSPQQSACLAVENFHLYKLVSAILCGQGDCLSHPLEVLTSISLDEGAIKVNTGSKDVFVPHTSTACSVIPVGFIFNLTGINLFNTINIRKLCVSVEPKTSQISAVAQIGPVALGPLFLTRSNNPQCEKLPEMTSSCKPATFGFGPKFLLQASVGSYKFEFDGNVAILGANLDTCMKVETNRIFAEFKLNLSTAIQFDAMLSTSYTKSPPNFDFEVSADLTAAHGLIEELRRGVSKFFAEFNVQLESAAAKAKSAMQKAMMKVSKAKSALKRAEKRVHNKFAPLLRKVHRAENKVSSVRRSCKRHGHRCRWYRPWECVAAGACWIEYGVCIGGLKIAEGALHAAEAVADGALKLALHGLDAANLVLKGATSVVNAAVSAVEGLERLAISAIKIFASILDVSSIGFHAKVSPFSLSGSFHIVGHVLGKPFDISFSGTLDVGNLIHTTLRSLHSVMSSAISGVSKKDSQASAEVLFSQTADPPLLLPGVTYEGSRLGDENIAHSLQFFLPRKDHMDEPPVFQNTDMVFAPLNALAPGEMKRLCDAIAASVKSLSHTSAYIDITRIPMYCSPDNQTVQPCLTALLNNCLAPAHAAMLERKNMYHDPKSEYSEVSSHHKSFMSPLMQRCDDATCHAFAHTLATDTWTLTVRAPEANGFGPLPKILSAMGGNGTIRYAFDLSENKFTGALPILSKGLVGLDLAGNWISSGFENLAQAPNLEYFDLSDNYGLRLADPMACLHDTLKPLQRLQGFSLHGSDNLVPVDPMKCPAQAKGTTKSGLQAIEVLNSDDTLIRLGLCDSCQNQNLQPLACLGYPCANNTVLEAKKEEIAKKMTEIATVPITPGDIDLLAADEIEETAYLTFRLHPIFSLHQAQGLRPSLRKVFPGLKYHAMSCERPVCEFPFAAYTPI
ncbi:hypothetical protein AAMO2058_001195700 [Amorphochlora amoebiformis]